MRHCARYISRSATTPINTPFAAFPARLHWLRTKLLFAEVPLPRVECENLNRWARFRYLDSISVISVSGYFGNPASTFGHLLIKLNNSGETDSDDLLDTGVNFGAAIPDDESLPVYIGKGLFGGYRASFSDKKFYAQYNVYGDSEARDMWEYKLALSHYQERLLVYHLWELVNKEYVYYFLRENCGLRMAEVLEMVLEADLGADSGGWYLPVELFHGLRAANDQRGGELIESQRYLPSKDKQFSRRYDSLNTAQKRYFDSYVSSAGTRVSLLPAEKSETLDALIAYYRYQNAIDRYAKEKQPERQAREKIIESLQSERAELGVDPVELAPDPLPAPSEGSRPNRIAVGVGEEKNGERYLSLRYSAVYFDIIGNNNFDHSELVVMDFEFRADEQDGLELERLDIISVQELANDTTGYLENGTFSWRAYAGINNKFVDCVDCRQLELRAGIGKSISLSNSVFGYFLLDGGLESENEDFVLSPTAGIVLGDTGSFKTHLEFGRQYFSETDEDVDVVLLRSKYELALNHEVRLQYQKNQGEWLDISYQYHW